MRDATVDGRAIRATLSIPQPLSGEGLVPISERLVATLPFTASLAEQGHLSRLEIDLPARPAPAFPAGRWTLTIDSYGTTPAAERPAPVKETPDDVYEAPAG